MHLPVHACLIQVACLIEVATKTGFTVKELASLVWKDHALQRSKRKITEVVSLCNKSAAGIA